ncbi:uncharacterized protein LOC144649406 [Oculina patagonica]
MDPFTQKLLARTQARKNQLVKKREELEACRAKRNSPIQDRSRRPLSEDNTDSGSGEVDTDNIKRCRIGSDDSGKSTILKNSKDIDVNSPSVQARKERLMKMQQQDQENGVTPKKHWKALTQGTTVNSSSTNSPSVASRSAAFENNAKDEQKENAKDKKPCELKMPHAPGKLAEARSVFENGASEKNDVSCNKKEKLFPPPKPPRVAATEDNSEERPVEQQQTTKRKAPSPPKETKENSNAKAVEHNTTVIKRKAPEPPTSNQEESKVHPDKSSKTTVKISEVECEQKNAKARDNQSRSSSVDEEGDGSCTPVPAKRERKGSVDSLDGIDKTEGDQPTPKPRRKVQNSSEAVPAQDNIGSKERRGKEKKVQESKPKKVLDNTVTIVATPVDEQKSITDHSKKKPQEQPCIIQACVVEENAPVVVAKSESSEKPITVKAVSSNSSEVKARTRRGEKTKVTSVEKTEQHSRKANVAEKVSNVIPAVAMEKNPPSSSRKTRESTKKDDFAFKVPRRPTKECQFDPNETVNLNDVNIHEITFSFDFGQFDQELEKERDSMFKMSYEEKCKQLEKEQKREEKKRKDSASANTSADAEREERGTYQSGYNNQSSEQYATKTTHKPKPAVPQRPKRTQDVIKTLLEEAAYQQNIVLQASQALNLCVANDITFRGSQEEIEAERVLLLATEHRTACLDEVQKLKTGAAAEGESTGSATPACMATLSLSDVKITLRQDFMDVLRVGIRHDLGVFHFVCIIQHGPHKFYCSRVLSTNDATEGNFLIFPDKFTLKDIKPDFNVAIKVFCMNVKKTVVATPATPTKHKIFQSPKVVKGILRRGSDTPSPAPQVAASPHTVFRTSSFSLVGVTHVNLPIIKSKRFSLDKVPDSCPLSNFIEMRAECSPQYSNRVNGFLTILEDIGGYGAWQRRWCVLQGAVMCYWRYPGDESIKPPMGCINLAECISEEVTRVARDLCARPNTMELKLKRSCGTEVKYLLAADTKADRATWIDSLNEALRDGRAWSVDEKKPLYPDLSRMHNQDVYMCSKVDV